MNMHRLDIRRPLPLAVTILSVAVLILTTVRSSWLALAIGVLTYVILSPKRGKALFAIGAVGIVSFALLVNASALLGNSDVTSLLTARLSTLGNVEQDVSVADRQQQTVYALKQGLSEPLGQGLGTVGTSTWLEGSSDDSKVSLLVLDDGYIARFLEMGVAGCMCYVATLAFGIIFGYRALMLGSRTRSPSLQQIAVTGLSLQAALIGLDLSGDSHSLLAGLFFWMVLGMALRFEPNDEERRSAWDVTEPPAPIGRTQILA
jgi:O-antigen ligase